MLSSGPSFTMVCLLATFQIYWSDTTGSAIRRANYDGSQPEVFLDSLDGLMFPEGVAVDWLARNIYWTDSGKRTIEVANLDTKQKKILFDEQIKNPRDIALHPSERYWHFPD